MNGAATAPSAVRFTLGAQEWEEAMTKLFLLAGAAALIGAGPALAKPGGGHGNAHVVKAQTVHVAKVRPAKARVVTVKSHKAKRSWVTACPRGLVWRGATCIPPGHRTKLLAVGARVPSGWAYTPWGTVPVDVRSRYDLDPAYRYIYRDNVIYVVNPRTHLITSILSAVL
jgi:hypothetical protein